jgi:cold-inducible RNA-binding protein
MNTKLYVGNLPYDTTENDLQDLFTPCGPVSSVELIIDRATNRSRGFGFVTMGTPEAAENAVQQLNGKSIEGRALTVNEARPRESREGGGAGRGPRPEGRSGGRRDREFSRR